MADFNSDGVVILVTIDNQNSDTSMICHCKKQKSNLKTMSTTLTLSESVKLVIFWRSSFDR